MLNYRIFSTIVSLLIASPLLAQSLQRLESELAKKPDNVKIRERIAQIYLRKNQQQKVIDLLSPYSNEISNESLINLATAYSQQKDSLNEIRILQLYTDKEPQKFRPHYLLGLALKNAKKYNEAAESLRQSILYASKHRPSYDALLEIFNETKQNYESRTLLNDMSRQFGAKSEFANALCRLYAIDNFLAEAAETCKKALSQNPKHADNHIYLAQTYYNQGNKPAAEKIFRNAGRQFKKSEFTQYATGEFYLNDKNYPAAVRYLEIAVKLNNKSLRSHLTLALAQFENKDYEKSLLHFDSSCRLDKSNETLTLLKNSAARLRQSGQNEFAQKFDRKVAICQSN